MPSRAQQVRMHRFAATLAGAVIGLWDAAAAAPLPFQLTSPAFEDGRAIPAAYACDGGNISPQLIWTEPPDGTRSFALIMEDADAPGDPFLHWTVYNLPPSLRLLREAFPPNAQLPDGTRQGLTDFGQTGYGGPCPPDDRHRYIFTVYALDALLEVPPRAAREELDRAIDDHVLARAPLTGVYQRRAGRTGGGS